jgi:proteasome lid subunit RPN8/RPN11
MRFNALRAGVVSRTAFALEPDLTPIWDSERGRPYVQGIRGRSSVEGRELQVEFSRELLVSAAVETGSQLQASGLVDRDEVPRFVPLAFARPESITEPPSGRLSSRATVQELDVPPGLLSDYKSEALGTGMDHADRDDIPVFVPEEVLDELRARTREQDDRETGGLLVGHVRRDLVQGDLFLAVTAQLPAQHVDATSTRLTFTSDTWTDFRSTLALRARQEVPLGWWHSHPVRHWCRNCTEDQRRVCSLGKGFLSADDRLLHRAVFPRAYSVALVVNDVERDDPTFSLFGWRRGLLDARAFTRLAPLAAAHSHDGAARA